MVTITQHEVTGPVAVIEAGGTSRYLYKGAVLPDGVTNLKHLVAVGLVAKVTHEVPDPAPTEAEVQAALQAAPKAKADQEATATAATTAPATQPAEPAQKAAAAKVSTSK